jgi:hypothetical protein
MSTGDHGIRQTLDQHAAAIASLSTKVSGIESTLRDQSAVLGEIRTALTRHEATKPMSAREWMGAAREGVILAGAFTALIYFIIRPELVEFKSALNRVERRIDLIETKPEPAPKIVYRTAPAKPPQ